MTIQTAKTQRSTSSRDEGFVRNYLLYLLAAASDAASGDFHVRVRQRGLRVPEWRVLSCLGDHDGQMVTQLAGLALMEQTRLTKIIDQMAERGLVSRRDDRRDRRRVRVFLTPAGRRLAEELVEEARAHERWIVERLAPGEAAELKQSLKQVMTLFGKLPPVPADQEDETAGAG